MFLIVGRTASGKDYLASRMEDRGYKAVISRTTRPSRGEGDRHIFLTEEQAKLDKDRVANTVINGYQYYTTVEDIEGKDIYIVDPVGLKSMSKLGYNVDIIYVKASEEERRKHFTERGETDEKFNSRNSAEDKQFTEFEEAIDNMKVTDYIKHRNLIVINNKYNRQFTEDMIDSIEGITKQYIA